VHGTYSKRQIKIGRHERFFSLWGKLRDTHLAKMKIILELEEKAFLLGNIIRKSGHHILT